MLAQNFDTIDLPLLTSVCENHWPESPTLDFKRDAPGNSDRDKQELLKDICAMANADGGDLVFGIREADGAANELVAITSEAADALARRITQTIETGIEPRLFGIQIAPISCEGGYALVVRVPASFLGPHCIKINGNLRRFVMRNGTSTSELTFEQLRSAFDRTASLSERARTFIRDRNRALELHTTPKPLINGPIAAVHAVPLSGLAGRQAIDLRLIHKNYIQLLDRDWGGGSRTFNLDGLVIYPGGAPDGEHYGYTQIFRNGAMEAASLMGGSRQQHASAPEEFFVWSGVMTIYFRDRISEFLNLAKEHGLAGPAVISFSIMHVDNYGLAIGSRYRRNAPMADRPHLIAPDLWVDNIESASVDEIVRPLVDTLWQGFGMEYCFDYDPESGEFRPQQ